MGCQIGKSGNPSGRKRSNWRTFFDATIEVDAKKHKQPIFEYALERARTDNKLLAVILSKCLLDLKAVETKVDTVTAAFSLATTPRT